MPKISVIIPVYNVKKYLKHSVESVLSQNVDSEIILVDDGSTDGSGELCDSLVCENVRVVHTENGGLSAARNNGLKNSKGDYVCFLDSDDYLDDGALAHMLQKAESTAADIVVCGFYIQKEDGRKKALRPESTVTPAFSLGETFLFLKRTHLFDSACNKLYRRSFLTENSLLFAEGEIFEDTDFNLRAFENNPLVCVSDACFYHYMQRPDGSITKSFNARKQPTLKRRAQSLYEYCSKHCIEALGFCGIYYFKSMLSALADTYMQGAEKIDRRAAINTEINDKQYNDFLKIAKGQGAENLILLVAKTKSVALITLSARMVYFIKYKR